MPIPLIWLIGTAVTIAAGAVIASTSSSSSEGSSASLDDDIDHEAIETQKKAEEVQRKQRLQKDITQEVSNALNLLGWPYQFSESNARSLADSILLKTSPGEKGEELIGLINELELGSNPQRQMFTHFLMSLPAQQRSFIAFEDGLLRLRNQASVHKELEQLRDHLEEACKG